VDGDLLDIVLSRRADGHPFTTGRAEYFVTLSISGELT
jgi:hypothetical protein